MENINQKLTGNYQNEVKEYIKKLMRKGFVLFVNNNGNQSIYQYNVKAGEYLASTYNLNSLSEKIMVDVPNYFHVDLNIHDCINMIVETLPSVTFDEMEALRKYNKATMNIQDEKQLKQELKELNTVIKKKHRNINTTTDDVFEQMQVLVNAGIVFTENRESFLPKKELYKFNSKTKMFDKVKENEINQLLEKTFNSKFNPKMTKVHMFKEWFEYGIRSNLPTKWNKNIEYQKNIYEFEKCKLNTIIKEYN